MGVIIAIGGDVVIEFSGAGEGRRCLPTFPVRVEPRVVTLLAWTVL